jgi:hypothetical protein
MLFDHRCFLPWEDSARIAARGAVLAVASIGRHYTQRVIVLSMTSMISLLRAADVKPLPPQNMKTFNAFM